MANEEHAREPRAPQVRVLILDPHASFRFASKAFLQAEGLAVVADLERWEGAEDVATALRPDVMLIDVSPWQTEGLELARRLSDRVEPRDRADVRESLGRDPGRLGRGRPLPRQGRHHRGCDRAGSTEATLINRLLAGLPPLVPEEVPSVVAACPLLAASAFAPASVGLHFGLVPGKRRGLISGQRFAVVIAVVAALVVPAAAKAGVATVAGGTAEYVARSGEANAVSVTFNGTDIVVRDTGARVMARRGCRRVSASEARCYPSGVSEVLVDLGDLAYTSLLEVPVFATQLGGPGNDVLNGGRQTDALDGGTGADAMSGGGDPYDHVLYDSRTAPVTITLDGVADDGEAGEGDNVGADIERATGGSGDDLIVGN